MRDKRSVDDLSVEELERILMVRKREARMQRFRGGNNDERRVVSVPVQPDAVMQTDEPPLQLQPSFQQEHDDGLPRFEEDLPDRAYPPVYPSDSGAMRRVTSAFFFLVEVGAIAGLVGVLFLAYQGLTTVNENIEKTDSLNATSEAELAMRREQPSPTPLISVSQVVLPGGHVWDETGRHRFNLNEVPAPYRSAFQQQLDAPRTELAQTVEGGPIRLQIPAINVDAGIRTGDDWISLQAGVGHHPFSGNPGTKGNMVLTAHNDIFGEIFRRIEELKPGDEVRVQSTNGQWYTYLVQERQIVDPTEVWVLDQSLGQETPLTTLITCYPYRVDTQRVVVFAELVDS